MKPKNVKKWGQNKKAITNLLAPQLIGSPKDIFELLESIRTGELYKKLPRKVSTTQWHKLYMSHRQLGSVLVDTMLGQVFKGISNSKVYSFMRYSSREFDQLTPEEKEAFVNELLVDTNKKGCQKQFEKSKQFFDQMQNGILGTDPKDKFFEYYSNKKMQNLPEFAFFLRVWMPCWIYHREYPTRLYWKARNGDDLSICKLALFDKTIIYEPRIAKYLLQLHEDNKIGRFNKIISSVKSKPKKLSLKKIKYRTAAMVQIFSSEIEPLTAPSINKLQDAFERDQSSGKVLRDTDLPSSPETFSKALQRERKEWKSPKQ